MLMAERRGWALGRRAGACCVCFGPTQERGAGRGSASKRPLLDCAPPQAQGCRSLARLLSSSVERAPAAAGAALLALSSTHVPGRYVRTRTCTLSRRGGRIE
jgi:hypothetical protein